MTALVEVTDLVREYPAGGVRHRTDRIIRAVDGVSFTVAPGETLGLVGESGCGKSTLGRTLLRLEPPTAGRVAFEGIDLATLAPAALRRLRRRMQVVFQDTHGALNPRHTIGTAIAEGLAIHDLAPAAERPARVAALLEEVGLDPGLATRHPHQLSGGQRQRVGIARALALEPAFVVCDEPVSALDVSVQAQVLGLLLSLRARRNLAYLFIAHDLAVVRQVAHRVAVMYLGRIVEIGPASLVIGEPRHPYTRALVSAVPRPDPTRPRERIVLAGEPPVADAQRPGCPFAPRCFHPSRDARCTAERPVLREVAGRQLACHHES